MEYKKADLRDLQTVFEIVQRTIKAVYPKYYPQGVVDFFSQLHNEENIKRDIESGTTGLLFDNGAAVGTGCYKENHITRVYVLPEYQNKGCGNYIMDCLEQEIARKFDRVNLDASLPASHLYEKRGYKTIKHESWTAEDGAVLVYEIMEKELAVKEAEE